MNSSTRHRPTRFRRIALIGMPILQEVGNMINVAIARYANRTGHWRFILNTESTPEAFRFLRTLDCDGAIVRITSMAMQREALKCPFPLVNISSWLADPQVPTVRVDSTGLGRLAAAHLLEKGFRHFGCVVVPGGCYINDRFKAFAETVRRAGGGLKTFHLRTTQPQQPLMLSANERERFKQWVVQLQPPAALALMDDWDAPTLLDLCREAGREIPRDLVVISTGIHAEVLPLCQPALTGAQENLELLAQMTVDCLEKLMSGKKPAAKVVEVPPLGVVERASTATMAIRDREVAHAVEFIRAHGCEPISMVDVAERSGISRVTLARRFKLVTGLTPHKYILQHRLERVKELLLADPAMCLEKVARQTGFPDRRGLNRIFLHAVGQLPRAWVTQATRKRHTAAV